MTTFSETLIVNAPVTSTWRILSDIGTISEWNPGVVDSRLTSQAETGLEASRHCDLKGGMWLKEDVVHFAEGEAITFRIVDSNLPFAGADIAFQLEDHPEGTKVTVSPTYRLKYGPLGVLMDSLFVRKSYRKGMRSLLGGLKKAVEA